MDLNRQGAKAPSFAKGARASRAVFARDPEGARELLHERAAMPGDERLRVPHDRREVDRSGERADLGDRGSPLVAVDLLVRRHRELLHVNEVCLDGLVRHPGAGRDREDLSLG
jgi:hypothetical protein